MTVVTTIVRRTIFGNKRVVFGNTVLSGAVKTADLDTGMASVEFFTLVEIGGTAKAVSVNETFPCAGNAVTVFTESDDATFSWLAIGV